MSKKNKIVRFRNPFHLNIGVIIFFIIIIYVLFNLFSYFTTTHIAEYQVQQGTIASNNIYQGIIVRDETVEYAGYKGYINYYMKNGSKVSVNDVICSIDMEGSIAKKISSSAATGNVLSTESLSSISGEIATFINGYNNNKFSESYTFFQNLNTEIAQNLNTAALADLASQVNSAEGNNTFFRMKSPYAGVIVYEVDEFENYSVEDIITQNINYNEYTETNLFSATKVNASDPIYKRVNSENWNIVVPITESLAKELAEKSSVTIRFCKDNYTTTAGCELIKNEGNYFLNLSLIRGMVRYINDRFIDIELVMSEKTGLKIPQSSITSKEFFTIPKEYFSKANDSDKLGICIQSISEQDETEKTITPTLYYETENYYYIDSEDVSEGEVILMPNSSSTYIIGTDKASLVGVYNINKGYAVFKQINIIYENEEYAIVETKTSYGISLYDHIALDASKIKENQLTAK